MNYVNTAFHAAGITASVSSCTYTRLTRFARAAVSDARGGRRATSTGSVRTIHA